MKKLRISLLVFIIIGIFFQGTNLYSIDNSSVNNKFQVKTILIKKIFVNLCHIKHNANPTININQNGNNESNFTVFPNPTMDILNISNLSSEYSSYNIKIMNIIGEKVYSGIISNKESSINISSFSTGIYFIILESGIFQKMLKFQKI
jgi:hypothetical protein